MDFQKYYDVIDSLVDLVAADQRLAEFLPQLRLLREQALSVSLGGKQVPLIPRGPRRALPDRTSAEAILAKVNQVPFCEPDNEDPEAVRILYCLSSNLVSAILHAVIEGFPELVSVPGGLKETQG